MRGVATVARLATAGARLLRARGARRRPAAAGESVCAWWHGAAAAAPQRHGGWLGDKVMEMGGRSQEARWSEETTSCGAPKQ